MDENAILAALNGLGLRIDQIRADLMARMDRMQEELIQRYEDGIATFGRADRAISSVKKNETDIYSLSEELAAVHRKVLRLETRLNEIEGRR
jgi:hypothetical protein